MRTYALGNPADPVDRPTWVDRVDNPYLHGPYTPVVSEVTAVDLEVVHGEIPDDLYGAYMRNGPNPVFEPKGLYHWFDGDGMVHGVYFRNGRASYVRKWIWTRALRAEIARGRAELAGVMGPFDLARVQGPLEQAVNPDYCKDTANTTLTLHNGRLLAQWYNAGRPCALDPLTLETIGEESFGGAIGGTLNAHPKVDPRTGEYIDYDYGDFKPYLDYYVIGADGALKHRARVDLPGPRLPHDTTITRHYTILHDFPLYHDTEVLRRTGHRVVEFHRDTPSRFGVIPRYGTQAQVRWFEFTPGYVLHMVNAWEEGDWIVMDGCFQPDPTIRRDRDEGPLASMLAYLRYRGHLRRWRMNLKTGESSEEQLDDLNVEFCLPDAGLYGVRSRYSYHQRVPTDLQTLAFDALVKYDHESGAREIYEYGPGWFPSEAPFAKSTRGGDEDSGYVVTLATQIADYRSEAWVFDAKRITAGPIAKVRLPARVAAGFHASWFPGRQLWPGAGAPL
ncbi:MAG: carotenoid oxygenase family protein [Steroidobacteraceae bacterium]|nr:carotenoid oxygenase family protein [Steroidobacteraceae bacterium]MCW5572269.1 carotenoid oxygenase family protein [Steroidobacteraceae bacterium]